MYLNLLNFVFKCIYWFLVFLRNLNNQSSIKILIILTNWSVFVAWWEWFWIESITVTNAWYAIFYSNSNTFMLLGAVPGWKGKCNISSSQHLQELYSFKTFCTISKTQVSSQPPGKPNRPCNEIQGYWYQWLWYANKCLLTGKPGRPSFPGHPSHPGSPGSPLSP